MTRWVGWDVLFDVGCGMWVGCGTGTLYTGAGLGSGSWKLEAGTKLRIEDRSVSLRVLRPDGQRQSHA